MSQQGTNHPKKVEKATLRKERQKLREASKYFPLAHPFHDFSACLGVKGHLIFFIYGGAGTHQHFRIYSI